MSLIREPKVYERYEQVVLMHGVREVKELAYHDYIGTELPAHESGRDAPGKLLYYPTVTRSIP